VEYFTAAVQHGSISTTVNATGVVQTRVTVQVGSQVSGQIEQLYADFNSAVKRGQLLARLDPRNFETQVQNAEASVAAAKARVRSAEAEQITQAANLRSARANMEAGRVARDNAATIFDRAAESSWSGLVSQTDLDNSKAAADSAQAKYEQAAAAVEQVESQQNAGAAGLEQARAQLQQAMAELDRARVNLGYTNIYSPIDGVVISRNVDVGQTIAASLQSPTLFAIANDLTKMQVHANVDEADIGSISEKADVRFTVDAYPNELFRARIAEIRLSPQTVQNVVTYSVILGIDNPELKLKPGMTANITITVDRRDNVLRMPNAALRYVPAAMSAQHAVLAEEENPEMEEPAESMIPVRPQAPVSASDRQPASDNDGLAPGQMWRIEDKIRFVAPRHVVNRRAIVWILEPDGKPAHRRVVLGITDGSATEIVSGDIKAGDAVVVGDSSQAGSPASLRGPSLMTPFGGPRGR
jgi:HlyD family secretion protein